MHRGLTNRSTYQKDTPEAPVWFIATKDEAASSRAQRITASLGRQPRATRPGRRSALHIVGGTDRATRRVAGGPLGNRASSSKSPASPDPRQGESNKGRHHWWTLDQTRGHSPPAPKVLPKCTTHADSKGWSKAHAVTLTSPKSHTDTTVITQGFSSLLALVAVMAGEW
jgi:hypothetical protein